MPLIALILQGIPEQIAVVTLAFVIARVPLDWKKIILGGIFLALSVYLLRMLPITFGVHTIVLIGFLFFIVFRSGQVSLTSSIITSILSILTLIILEIISLSILMPVFNITHDVFVKNVFLRILITLPQVLLIFIVAFVIRNFLKRT